MDEQISVTEERKSVTDDMNMQIELNPNGAKKMADYLLDKEFKGRGDTFEAAFLRIQTKYGVSASLLNRLTSKCRSVNDMMLSNYADLFIAYHKACERAEKRYQHERELHEINPFMDRLANKVAGVVGEKEGRLNE